MPWTERSRVSSAGLSGMTLRDSVVIFMERDERSFSYKAHK